MARWNNRRRSSNVERVKGGGAVGAGLIFLLLRLIFTRFGIFGIVILVGGFFALRAVGIDPMQLVAGGQGGQAEVTAVGDGQYDDEIMAVVASTEDTWSIIFREEGLNGGIYPAPKVRIFSGAVQTACGNAPSAVGPFYCPADKRVYFDTSFFQELQSRFGAGGDFPRAYVIAHEVGHHVQTVTGISNQVRSAQQGMGQTEGNQMQVRMELQADCFAGLWAYYEKGRALEAGDIEEALTAAAAIGDDTLQRRSGGTVKPESFTHGTSEQRKRWFYRGFDSGQYGECDTFSAAYGQL